MKKQYISPATEQINFFAEEALMAASPTLRMDAEEPGWLEQQQLGQPQRRR